MAKFLPIKGLDSDLEKIVSEVNVSVQKRDELNEYIDVMSKVQDYYLQIKILYGTLSFAVKEVEFSAKTLSNLKVLVENSSISSELKDKYSNDEKLYATKYNEALTSALNKREEFNFILNDMEKNVDLFNEKNTKSFIPLDQIINDCKEFINNLNLDEYKLYNTDLTFENNDKKEETSVDYVEPVVESNVREELTNEKVQIINMYEPNPGLVKSIKNDDVDQEDVTGEEEIELLDLNQNIFDSNSNLNSNIFDNGENQL